MKDEVKNLIGTTTEVIVGDKVKEIFVKDVFENSNGKCLIEDSKGDIYSEDDINWRYKLSLGSCLMIWLDKFGYIDINEAFEEEFDISKYEAQLKDLFELLIKQGYIAGGENE